MSNMLEHAKRELDLIGEDEEVKDAILKIVEVFAGMGHSGASAEICIAMITALLNQENLTLLTDDPKEWYFHGEERWGSPGGIWQSTRNGQAFSTDGGKTYHLLSDGSVNGKWGHIVYTSKPHKKDKTD